MDLRVVDPDIRKRAHKLFDKSEEMVAEDTRTIKEWIKSQKHFPEVMEEEKIRNFLLLTKHNIDKAKEKIEMYYRIRTIIPELYNYSNPKLPNMVQLVNSLYICPHPRVHYQGIYSVYFFKIDRPMKISIQDVVMHIANIGEVRLYEDCMIGEILFIDMNHITLKNVADLSPNVLAKGLTIYEKVYSIGLKEIHFINSPCYISAFLAIFKRFIKPKIFERIQVHHDSEILHKYFTEETLPRDYGGKGPTFYEMNEMLKAKFAEYEDRFDQLDKLEIDFPPILDKSDEDESLINLTSSFRKLRVGTSSIFSSIRRKSQRYKNLRDIH